MSQFLIHKPTDLDYGTVQDMISGTSRLARRHYCGAKDLAILVSHKALLLGAFIADSNLSNLINNEHYGDRLCGFYWIESL